MDINLVVLAGTLADYSPQPDGTVTGAVRILTDDGVGNGIIPFLVPSPDRDLLDANPVMGARVWVAAHISDTFGLASVVVAEQVCLGGSE